MIKDIQELNFPSYATLSSATVTLNDMGDRTISAQVKIDGSIVPDFSYDWEVEFKGERYIQPLRQPQASKGNESMRSTIDLVFYHKTIWQLKRYYFVEMTSTESGTAIADQYIASLGLNLSDFCVAFQKVLDHYFDGEISIDLNPNLDYTKGVQFMSISYSYIWDVLQKMYEVYGVRWAIEGNTIKVGYPSPILSHTFQYGYEGGLLQVERQVQDANIRNSLLGRGGEKNLPYRYFKDIDPNNPVFLADPDWIPELASVNFTNLRGKTFRDYIKGWKAQRYGGTPMSEPTEEYNRGYADSAKSEDGRYFNPIEYVEDKESIKKYGLLQGALDNNEEIYPSIQNAPNGEDVVVYVEPVTTDEVAESVRKESVITNIEPSYITISMPQNSTSDRHKLSVDFEVPEGKVGYLSYNIVLLDAINKGNDITDNIIFLRKEFTVQNLDTLEKVDSTYYETGKYRYTIDFTLKSESNYSGTIKATVGIEQAYIESFDSIEQNDKWLPTFNIWVKNIWHSTRNAGESDQAYADRVWLPILGDREGNKPKVVFSSGWLSGHEDYEFTIVDFAYDNSHEHNGTLSEWRLTLNKSDAELEATGKYIPSASTNGQAYAGDTFFFIGVDMPHQYVLWAEERLDNYKTSSLNEVSEIQPKWVVRFDKLRLHEGGDSLAEQIVVGGAINLADVRFIDAPSLQLYLQSVTYTWNEQTLLYPDIEVVLADTIVPVQNPVAQLQGSIDAINSQLYNIGNVAQTVRKIGDSLYLRKDGVADTSKSPTKFVGNVSGNNFRQGKAGGADWGIYRDENGNAIAEFDKIIARKDLEVNNLVINQVSYVGGMQITSAASLEITRVIENGNAYQCFFDQKGGSVANLFQVNDIAYSQRFDERNNTTKYYKRVVTEVGVDYITLSKSQADGVGVPMANDVVIHYGNTTDTNRQYVIIRDVIGGGYERMLSDLNSVNATGTEYYFAGRMDGNTPRWFVGNNGQYIEYKNDKLDINAQVHIRAGSTGASNLADLPEVVKEAVGDIEVGTLSVGHNLLRNSGFTGDYRPTEVKAADAITVSKEVYSDALKYWDITNAQVQQSDFSQSGVEVVLTDGSLTQTLKDEIVVGDTYIFSFYAKGESLNFAVAGITQTRNLTDTYERYVLKFKAVKNNPTLQIRNANATICMLQLERGNVPTAWGVSVYDNDKSLAYFQALQYLSSAIKDGSVDILGGLILANMLLLGNYQNGEMQQVTAGVSGVYNDDDDVAFWAGGAMEKAITTVRRFRENPRYQPTDEEWADMANFVATHGGDLFIKGYIFALGGFFRGTVSIANGKILLNEDGSGRLSNGALEWDKEGRLYKNFPDMINWRSLRSSNIDYSKGGYYIAESLSEKSFTLATPPVMPYRVVLKAADAITTDHQNVTLVAQDGARFFYAHPDDPNTFYGGMSMTITTTNNAAKGLIELTRNGATWDVFVPSTMTVGTTGMITDILIF